MSFRMRLIVVLVVLPLLGLLLTSDAAVSLLRAVDFLAPKPGLSGLVLVFLSPIGFIGVVALGAWALRGARRKRQAASGEADNAP